MKILVTGAKGFVGKNLVLNLKNQFPECEVFEFDKESTVKELESYVKNCDFVYHLAGVNRPKTTNEFVEGNFDLTKNLLELIKKHKNKCPILITSSIQASLDNDYGKSKKMAEDLMFKFSKENGNKAFVYRLPNLFGKWCRPNYNSVVATWCYNIANGLDIQINDPSKTLELAYIDDVVSEFIKCLDNKETKKGNFCIIPTTKVISLGSLAKLIKSFKNSRFNLEIPMVNNAFAKKLYSTYLSYLPENGFAYNLKMNKDNRGSFTECFKTKQGQVSVNVCKPGITKGNHYHNTKVEKFLVVKGKGIFEFRKVGTDEVISYNLSSKSLKVLDIPPGYTHNFTNTGKSDLIVLIWCNEKFNKRKPDTYFEKV